MLGVLATCAKWVVFGPPIIPEVLAPAGAVEICPNDNVPKYVHMPIGRSTSFLPRNLEQFAVPYGARRSRQTRREVQEGLFPGGEEHSYRLLYQQRLRRILQSYPLSFADPDPACDVTKWSVLQSYAAGAPVSESLEWLIRHTIEDCIYEMWAVDEIVRQLRIRQSAGQEGWFHHVKLMGVKRPNAKRCEFWDESRGCEFFFNPKTEAEKSNAAVIHGIEARLKKSLKTFAKSDFDKPLRYLAMCVFQYAASSKRLGNNKDKGTSTRKLMNRIEGLEATLYEEAAWMHRLMHGGKEYDTDDDDTKKDDADDDDTKKDNVAKKDNVDDDDTKKDDRTAGAFQKISSCVDVAGQGKGGSVKRAKEAVMGLCRGLYRNTTCPDIVVTFAPEEN